VERKGFKFYGIGITMTRKLLCDRFACPVARITSRQPVWKIIDDIIGKLQGMANILGYYRNFMIRKQPHYDLGFFTGDGDPPEYQIKLFF
jgi:hypothetical protein